MARWLLLLLLVGAPVAAWADCTGASPAWSCASWADLETLVEGAASQPGDTITLVAGTYAVTSTITLSKSLTIQGEGNTGCPTSCNDATTIQPGSNVAFTATADTWRISGITLDGGTNGSGIIWINAGGTAEAIDWRIDHCHFKDVTGFGIHVSAYGGAGQHYGRDHPGVIDSNRFSHATFMFKTIQVYGHTVGDVGEWASPANLGGSNFVFIEDNIFDMTSFNDNGAVIDSDSSARMVIRFNDFTMSRLSAHGVEDADPSTVPWRSTHATEWYKNTFAGDGWYRRIEPRGGTGVVWKNRVTGTITGRPIHVYYTRGDITPFCTGVVACDGDYAYDGNTTGLSGYPCYQQPGMTGSNGITPAPIYVWGNTWGDITDQADLSSIGYNAGDCPYQHVQFGRDVILVPTANEGTSLPGTCTVADGYWKTNEGTWNKMPGGEQGVLYKCTAPDTWTLFYTPYTYPHPLRGESPASGTLTLGGSGSVTLGGSGTITLQ